MDPILRQFLRLSDAVMITDRHHVIIDVNEQYEKITGYFKTEVIGSGAGITKSRFTPEHMYQSLKQSLRNEQSWSGVFINKKKSGELWHSSISITPFILGGICYYVGIFRELEQLTEGMYIAEARKDRIQRSLLQVLATSCEIRDPGIEEHLIRVRELTEQLLLQHNLRLQLNLSREFLHQTINSSILHDIGKSGVPEGILYKPGPLASYERAIIETHPLIGVDILTKIAEGLDDDLFHEEFAIAKNIIVFHHEKWDGKGYPYQLKGVDIPLEARIVAVVDVYDALTSRRSYKDCWSQERALEYLIEQKGRQFDPDIVDTFIELPSHSKAEHAGVR